MPRKKKKPKLRIARDMPPLYHTLPGEPYNYKNSEVLKWLAERPALIEQLFEDVNSAKDIIYDPETGKWQGVNYDPDEE
ncbi:hypothetical protein [Oceanobacillus oncorhynchi]|uniref:hypothetical protein n=1 Tax=Oceanobacillus oncorhynchi TaxID=545501 RepID=UPI0025A3C8DD|nr:hypothetical protein [Oceanobacillus oncorhynchi]MDM8100958.1 hypothetical protein [Oceanobacillus oncorhynchi]